MIKTYDSNYRGPCPVEAAEQTTFFNQLRLLYPQWAALAFHPRNEGELTQAQVRRHKAEGMLTGVSDVVIIGTPPFLCELKRRDKTKSRLAKKQIDFLNNADAVGAFACVAYGHECALEAFREWLQIVTPMTGNGLLSSSEKSLQLTAIKLLKNTPKPTAKRKTEKNAI